MARGNWRSGKDHGVAEVGGARKMIDGFVMKRSGSFATEKEAKLSANSLELDGYVTAVRKGRKHWNVWRTFRRDQGRLK
jgi:hypothetical protein